MPTYTLPTAWRGERVGGAAFSIPVRHAWQAATAKTARIACRLVLHTAPDGAELRVSLYPQGVDDEAVARKKKELLQHAVLRLRAREDPCGPSTSSEQDIRADLGRRRIADLVAIPWAAGHVTIDGRPVPCETHAFANDTWVGIGRISGHLDTLIAVDFPREAVALERVDPARIPLRAM